MRTVLFLLIGCWLYSPCSAQVMNKGSLATHPAFYRIPFEKVAEEVHDTVELGGQRYHFLLDSGAPLCISQAVQDVHTYPVILEVTLGDANARQRPTVVVLVDSLRWGGMLFLGVPAVVLDLANSPLARDGVEGLVGSNVLRHLVVRFDAARKEILFADEPARLGWDDAHASPGRLDGQDNFLLTCTIGPCFTDTVQFDSGMADLYLMNRSVAEAHLAECPEEGLRRIGGHGKRSEGLLGKDKGEKPFRMRATAVKLGDMDLGTIHITTTGSSSRMGRELLTLGTLTLNYPAAAYRFEPRGASE